MPPAHAGLIDFTAERGRHVRLLARLDEWLVGADDTRWALRQRRPGDRQELHPGHMAGQARCPRCHGAVAVSPPCQWQRVVFRG